MRIDSQLGLRPNAAALYGWQSPPCASLQLALRADAAALHGRQSHPCASLVLALQPDAAVSFGRRRRWARLGLGVIGLGLVGLGGCARTEGPKVDAVEESERIETREVLARAGAAELVGARAIAGTFIGEGGVALLVDGGGPRYVRLGGGEVVEVCNTAESIRATSTAVAVGCAKIGTTPPRVQQIDVGSGKIATIELPDPGTTTPTEASWPFVSHGLDKAAVATAAMTTIYGTADGAELFKYPSAEPHREVSDVAFAPDDQHIAVARNDGTIEIVDITQRNATPQIFAPTEPDRDPRIAFSPAGMLATASFWGSFQLLRLGGKSPIYQVPPAAERYGRSGVAFVGDTWIVQIEAGKLVLRTGKGALVELPTSDKIPARPFAPGLDGGLGFVASGPNGRVLTIAADGQTTIASRIRAGQPGG